MRGCLSAGPPEALQAEERDRWRAAFRAFREIHRTESVACPDDRRVALAFLRAFPRASGLHRSQVESVLTFLMDKEEWAATSRGLDQEASTSTASSGCEQPEGPGAVSCGSDGATSSASSSRSSSRGSLERMVVSVLEQHPDADALIPAALLELAKNRRHVDALRVLAPKPQRFRTYVMNMLEVTTSAQDEPVEEPEPRAWRGGSFGLRELVGLKNFRDLQQQLALCVGLDLSKAQYCLTRPP